MGGYAVGRAILPAAAFQAAPAGQGRIFALGKRRLSAGGSQGWLPHFPMQQCLCGLRGLSRGPTKSQARTLPAFAIKAATATAAARAVGLGTSFVHVQRSAVQIPAV